MEKIVSITKQGQLTIPRKLLEDFNIRGATKALVQKLGDVIVVKPKRDLWSLSGSLKSKISLTDKELQTMQKRVFLALEQFGGKIRGHTAA